MAFALSSVGEKLQVDKTVNGTVVDSANRPIASALIGYSLVPGFQSSASDGEGRFSMRLHDTCFVIRKIGYLSQRVNPSDNLPIHIVLLSSIGRTPPCTPKACQASAGFYGLLCLKTVKGVKAGKMKNDVDYGAESFRVKTAKGWSWILHGGGPTWSSGVPENQLICSSTQFQEQVEDLPGRSPLVSARGIAADRTFWRYLGTFGESADYQNVDQATAALLDEVLDGVCINKFGNR